MTTWKSLRLGWLVLMVVSVSGVVSGVDEPFLGAYIHLPDLWPRTENLDPTCFNETDAPNASTRPTLVIAHVRDGKIRVLQPVLLLFGLHHLSVRLPRLRIYLSDNQMLIVG